MFRVQKGLRDMATEPLTIRLLVGVMPDLKQKLGDSGLGSSQVTMHEILRIFIDRWIANEVVRLSRDQQYTLAEKVADIDTN